MPIERRWARTAWQDRDRKTLRPTPNRRVQRQRHQRGRRRVSLRSHSSERFSPVLEGDATSDKGRTVRSLSWGFWGNGSMTLRQSANEIIGLCLNERN